MTVITRAFLSFILLFPGPFWLAAGAEALPASADLVYEVKYGIFKLGSLSSRLVKQEHNYEVTNETHAKGIAAMLLGGTVREMCEFSVEENLIKPTRYRIVREGKDTFDYSATFDAGRGLISFNDGTNITISDGYVIDNCSAPFAFMLGGPDTLADNTLHIVGGRKVRNYQNNLITEENVKTPLGKFNTVKIEQARLDRSDRKLVIWLAPELSNLPVKIVEQRNNRPDTTLLLKSVQGL